MIRTESTAKQNDKIVHKFIEGFLDPRRRETKSLKKIHQACLKMIEDRISQTPDLKNLLSLYEHEPWMQKLLVNHVLFRVYHHAVLSDNYDCRSATITVAGCRKYISGIEMICNGVTRAWRMDKSSTSGKIYERQKKRP